jgi:hypothetical protein
VGVFSRITTKERVRKDLTFKLIKGKIQKLKTINPKEPKIDMTIESR